MLGSGDLNFSFSGLKTAVLTHVRKQALTEEQTADIARAFEDAVVDVLAAKALAALDATGLDRLVVAGGVGANHSLRGRLAAAARERGADVFFPDLQFCTDNGAMIALVGALRLQRGDMCDYKFTVRPRWDLSSLRAAATTSPAS
jgi:N6-L-threonylcarbamoyladenine synthase